MESALLNKSFEGTQGQLGMSVSICIYLIKSQVVYVFIFGKFLLYIVKYLISAIVNETSSSVCLTVSLLLFCLRLSFSLFMSVCLLMSFRSVALPHYAACIMFVCLAMILLKILTHARHT